MSLKTAIINVCPSLCLLEYFHAIISQMPKILNLHFPPWFSIHTHPRMNSKSKEISKHTEHHKYSINPHTDTAWCGILTVFGHSGGTPTPIYPPTQTQSLHYAWFHVVSCPILIIWCIVVFLRLFEMYLARLLKLHPMYSVGASNLDWCEGHLDHLCGHVSGVISWIAESLGNIEVPVIGMP